LGGFWALVFIGMGVYSLRTRRQGRAERELFHSGTKAMAVVEGVETTTGVRVNDNHHIALRLRVRPPDERRLLVPAHLLPRRRDVTEVAYDSADRTRVALATDWSGGRAAPAG
jgi:hypothetical protein